MTVGWRQHAACKAENPELFFTSGPAGQDLDALCRRCPSLIPCTFDALRRNDSGFQAGLLVSQRKAIRRWDRQQRGLETGGRPAGVAS
jgi:WhiB family redox-sensing transcriptional regulator